MTTTPTVTQNTQSPVYMMPSSTTPPPPNQTQSFQPPPPQQYPPQNTGYGYPPQNTQPQVNFQQTQQQMRENIKRQLQTKIEYKLRPIVEETSNNLKKEMDNQETLSARAQRLDDLDVQITNEEKQVDQEIETLTNKLQTYDTWIQNHEKKDIDVDKAIEPEDVYSKQ